MSSILRTHQGLFSTFLDTEVILVGNQDDFGTHGIMRAKLVGYVLTCRNKDCPVCVFQAQDGSEFSFAGGIFPFNEYLWKLLEPMPYLERFHFIIDVFNFKNDLNYALDQIRLEVRKSQPIVTAQPWYRRWLRR